MCNLSSSLTDSTIDGGDGTGLGGGVVVIGVDSSGLVVVGSGDVEEVVVSRGVVEVLVSRGVVEVVVSRGVVVVVVSREVVVVVESIQVLLYTN
jgi:hypothetical protein